jgi:hypothetical protein
MSKTAKKKKAPARTEDEIRDLLLRYFYDRNHNATSARSDKTGAAVKISVACRELKEKHGLTRKEVRRNLTYLISQGWIEEQQVTKNVPLKTGTIIPQVTPYYQITAAGIDKIEGPGEFTMPKFHGIKIEATGQNIITVGDGNQVDARFESIANELASFKEAVRQSEELAESAKLSIIADVDTIQSQLAKPEPNPSVISAVWSGIEKLVTGTSLAANCATLANTLAPMLT